MSASIDGDFGFDGSTEPINCHYCDEPAEIGRPLVTYSDGSVGTTLMHLDCFAEMAKATPCHDGYDDPEPEDHPDADDYADRAWDVPR